MAQALALVAFALVVGAAGGVGSEGDEGGAERGSFESFAAFVGDVLALDRGPPTSWSPAPDRRRRPVEPRW